MCVQRKKKKEREFSFPFACFVFSWLHSHFLDRLHQEQTCVCSVVSIVLLSSLLPHTWRLPESSSCLLCLVLKTREKEKKRRRKMKRRRRKRRRKREREWRGREEVREEEEKERKEEGEEVLLFFPSQQRVKVVTSISCSCESSCQFEGWMVDEKVTLFEGPKSNLNLGIGAWCLNQ